MTSNFKQVHVQAENRDQESDPSLMDKHTNWMIYFYLERTYGIKRTAL